MIAAAQNLCSQFNITDTAKNELKDARQKLYNTENDNSSDQVLQTLTVSEEGLLVLGICWILNSFFHWVAAAEFFDYLAKMSGMPEAITPARGRWIELARITSKIPPLDAFHGLVQKYSQLGMLDKPEDNDLEEGVGPIGVVSSMKAMSRIHAGQDDGRITILCGRSAGWHAAVAEWMFGLKIKLTTRDGRTLEGKTLYSNCPEDEVQLILAFNNPGVGCDGELVDDPPMPTKN